MVSLCGLLFFLFPPAILAAFKPAQIKKRPNPELLQSGCFKGSNLKIIKELAKNASEALGEKAFLS